MNIVNINRKLKGNVTIMVILILLACSLFGILTIIFLNSLISYTDDSYGYYKSYYMAKAGLELALTEIDNTDVGFENSVNSGDAIVVNNFDCPLCNFTSEIKGRSKTISNNFWETADCENGQKISISASGSMVLPMFYDNSTGFSELISHSNCLSGNSCEILFKNRMYLSLETDDDLKELNIGVIFLSGGDISVEYLYMQTLAAGNLFSRYFSNFWEYYNSLGMRVYLDTAISKGYLLPYIVLSNPTSEDIYFCVKNSEIERPATKYYISSIGEYMGKTVGLQAIYEQPVPSFLVNPYVNSIFD